MTKAAKINPPNFSEMYMKDNEIEMEKNTNIIVLSEQFDPLKAGIISTSLQIYSLPSPKRMLWTSKN